MVWLQEKELEELLKKMKELKEKGVNFVCIEAELIPVVRPWAGRKVKFCRVPTLGELKEGGSTLTYRGDGFAKAVELEKIELPDHPNY